MSSPKLYYWPIKARNYASLVIAKAGGVDVEFVSNPDLGELKKSGVLPFGQLPYLEDGDVKLAQSNAIVRYLAKKGGISGSTDAAFAMSEMLIEESADLFTMTAKNHYAADKASAWSAYFAAGGPM